MPQTTSPYAAQYSPALAAQQLTGRDATVEYQPLTPCLTEGLRTRIHGAYRHPVPCAARVFILEEPPAQAKPQAAFTGDATTRNRPLARMASMPVHFWRVTTTTKGSWATIHGFLPDDDALTESTPATFPLASRPHLGLLDDDQAKLEKWHVRIGQLHSSLETAQQPTKRPDEAADAASRCS
ncbi:hypothetical protein CDD80_4319 [Ophiocordyceps camponoti-rufipedis]|uniref:Uncharacterized protein n=1 Tax=Ophiocordyceps camponoti-rufipedis TaxID=2004952 RepID=A0A2C5ZGE0_9HYPO|nr:hypothetical protein CDD80_4319 [Ophiocordyceps camponoti-rufipedis]